VRSDLLLLQLHLFVNGGRLCGHTSTSVLNKPGANQDKYSKNKQASEKKRNTRSVCVRETALPSSDGGAAPAAAAAIDRSACSDYTDKQEEGKSLQQPNIAEHSE
jgi:hypothetical protein